jgi:hypothetical protein
LSIYIAKEGGLVRHTEFRPKETPSSQPDQQNQ